MLAIFKKEFNSFFSSAVGYLIIGFFLLLNGFFLWVFQGPYNVLDYGFANLSQFFLFTPWIFLLIIPAITMKSFSEEKKTGTLELLFIKPVGKLHLIGGKFLAAFVLVILALFPTLLYVYTISNLGMTAGNYDFGLVLGSYLGLVLLVMGYTAIGIFCSAITANQIVAFLLSLLLCFLFYYGFEALASANYGNNTTDFIKNIGMKYHFDGIALGVLKLQNILYFISLTILFLYLANVQLNYSKR